MKEYKVFQVKREKMRDFGFLGYEYAVRFNGPDSVKISNYDFVYTLKSEEELSLDDVYEILNLDRPEDFHGHSLSVSDVIQTEDGKYWYCDSFGWKELDDFE